MMCPARLQNIGLTRAGMLIQVLTSTFNMSFSTFSCRYLVLYVFVTIH